VSESITSFVGLDVHKDSTAIAEADAGRETPRFIGTVGPDLGQLLKALKSLGKRETMLVVYEAGPCGLSLRHKKIGRSDRVRPFPATHVRNAQNGTTLSYSIRRHHCMLCQTQQESDHEQRSGGGRMARDSR
jgi:hypothetical protein